MYTCDTHAIIRRSYNSRVVELLFMQNTSYKNKYNYVRQSYTFDSGTWSCDCSLLSSLISGKYNYKNFSRASSTKIKFTIYIT